ncbi:unnamed protein product [Auanema sp. JU1783]|nr:unnamed protein product [Auanema sp. JU1783]
MSNQTPYIGSKISLISKLDIRYEGILYTVDTNDSTIALAKVKSFGTENRNTANPVAPRDDTYEYIIFKASDIKDLIVCETPKAPLAGGLPYDPAIISVSTRAAPDDKVSGGSTRSATPHRHSPNFASGGNRAPGSGRNLNRGGNDNRHQGNRQFNYNRGGYPNQNRGRGYNGPRTNTREKLKYEGDYDFEKANEQFQEQLCEMLGDKLKLESGEKSEEEEATKTEESSYYDKKNSFFDRISCEALEKAEGKSGRPDWRKERETNQETFGHSAVRSFNYRRGFGNRGRGRGYNGQGGGYGGYRGNQNGGYNGYRNNGYNNRGRNFNRDTAFSAQNQ